MASLDFPPRSVSHNTEQIVAQCEDLEARGSTDAIVYSVQMAALLFLGDMEGGKHLWGRSDQAQKHALKPWFEVLNNMLEWNVSGVWNALNAVTSGSQVFGPLDATYAREIANSYRRRLMPSDFVAQVDIQGDLSRYVAMLNLDEAECREFLAARQRK